MCDEYLSLCLCPVDDFWCSNILQPGSSVATSLAYTESHNFPKKYAVLEIKEAKKFRVKQHDYQQLRPFVYGNVNLKEHLDPRDSKVEEKLKAFLNDRVRAMIEEAPQLAESKRLR